LCSHNNLLYYGLHWPGDGDHKKNLISQYPFIGFESRRECSVSALCSHNGELYDGLEDGSIYQTLKAKKMMELEGTVNELCSVPKKLLIDAGLLQSRNSNASAFLGGGGGIGGMRSKYE